MTPEEIKELIHLIDQSSLREFEFVDDDFKLHLSKNEQAPQVFTNETQPAITKAEKPAPADQAQESTEACSQANQQVSQTDEVQGEIVESPLVGVAYLAPAPDKDNFVKIGDHVEKGQSLCIIEAMKIMNEIHATTSGEITNIFVNDGDVVEYGQKLFEIS
ncbi:acetyl-CoA carboxylase biotin carboxyl carrier protein [Aerococcus urinae]|uniref:Biotin carboxyl carrier protein of acetyl-CoA carboxylase n=1 Tax=Aerococcus urinae TaxID=1376 RepID=A0A0X8FEK7_9LACT|nr:acetyl-CoA carboxylase biotin carboxyl carrier protein [Aerococcus urinae]AMB95878.1 hypothetical protein AWM73_04850 [Aerococcus urinae]MCY3032462.1 acetyl-CoA carboxylase biotin carboxyl carrier protein [Aerococcus urinae]MCY3037326.1 acetyl-CoA carboxylase biotin carboxyl carrier protein [Aerococcus urinae]MCY3044508.1 acetyl-CoA carboxylase biotin carboxyl carrier protein [Aerococcus urinae]MCY3046102.1 acetyl-CoA carboxylase biotin carboxyl carrier protein [Aerococcus urinae]